MKVSLNVKETIQMFPSFNKSSRPAGKGINAPLDDNKRTALHIAAADKDEVSLQRLLRIGANPNQTDKFGQTPLFDAVKSGNLSAVKALANKGGRMNHRDDKGRNLIDWAIESGAAPTMLEALHRLGTDFDASPKTKQNALHTAAAAGRTELFEVLAGLGLSVNSRDKEGNTPLHLATAGGHATAMQKLIEMGADPNIRNTNIETPLYVAAEKGFEAGIDVLIALPRVAREVNSHANYSSGFTPLMVAAHKDFPAIIEKLFQVGADINQTDNRNRNSLYIAAETGNVEAAKKLVRLGADAGKGQLPRSNHTPLLHNISRAQYREMLAVLIGAGADINATDNSGNTALHRACDMTQTDKIQALLDFGANPNLVNDYGQRAIDELIDNYGYRMTDTPEIIAALLKKGASPDISPVAEVEEGPLHQAAQYGHRQSVELMLQHNAMVDSYTRGFAPKTALLLAAEHGHTEVAAALLEKGANPLKTDGQGRNALHLAAHNGNADLVKLLLEQKGMDVNGVDDFGRSALHHACLREKDDAAKILLAAGADADLYDKNGFTPLQLAVHMGNTDILPVFAEWQGDKADWNTRTAEKQESLLHLAVRHGMEAPVRKLIDLGADICTANEKGQSPLHLAIADNNSGIVDMLLKEMDKKNIHPDSLADKEGNTPLHIAVLNDHTPMVRRLQESGADLAKRNGAGDMPIHIAVREKHVDIVSFLVKQENISVLAPDKDGKTALQLALEGQNERIFSALLPVAMEEQSKQAEKPAPAKPEDRPEAGNGAETESGTAPKKSKKPKPPKPNGG